MASLLELVEALVRDPQAKAAYRADPDDFLERHGFGGLEPADLEEALHHAADSFPPTFAAQVDPAAGFDSLVQVDLQELGFDDELRPPTRSTTTRRRRRLDGPVWVTTSTSTPHGYRG